MSGSWKKYTANPDPVCIRINKKFLRFKGDRTVHISMPNNCISSFDLLYY